MSLLRLLTTGKSLVGGSETDSRYRLTSQRLLPHFGSARNPFGPGGKPTAAGAGVSPEAARARSRSTRADGRSEFLSETPQPVGPAGGLAPATKRAAASTGSRTQAMWRRVAGRLTGLVADVRRRLGRPRGLAPKPAVPKFTKQPVQGELSLDRIKVVRNDLSDADLEVVQVRRSAAAAQSTRGPRSEASTGNGSIFESVVAEASGPSKT